ncbi:YDG domain-containing protein, partial [Piscinibacter sakaiensis]
ASVAGGPYPIVASNATGTGFLASNYAISYVDGRLTVTPAELNAVLASIVGNPTKTYDGNTTATLTGANFSLTGFVGSDGATVTRSTGTYDSADAGARTVTTTLANGDFSPTGATDLRNYTLPTSA